MGQENKSPCCSSWGRFKNQCPLEYYVIAYRKENLPYWGTVDNSRLLISPCHPSKIFIVLAASCLAWVGVISMGVVFLTGISLSAGWIIAGTLLFAVAVWVVVMIKEIRDAIVLPDTSVWGERGKGIAGKSTDIRPRTMSSARSVMSRRGMTPGRGTKSHRRKTCPDWSESSASR